MVHRLAIVGQATASLLSVGLSVAILGLACWSPLFAEPHSAADPSDPGRKRPGYRRTAPVQSPPANLSQTQEDAHPAAEPRTESHAPVLSHQSSDPSPMRASLPGPSGPVIVGRVLYRGPVPASTLIEVTRDQDVCGATIPKAGLSIDAATHGLQDAVVHVEQREGMAVPGEPASTPSVVRNSHCRFNPHVAVAQVGTVIETINDDPVMHNTNITVGQTTALNVAMVAGGPPIKKLLKQPGLHLVKCNVHKFMQGYRLVFDDPFFAQTTETGQFTIAGVSPGTHTIRVWHETLGVLQKEIQVPARGTVVVDLEFK